MGCDFSFYRVGVTSSVMLKGMKGVIVVIAVLFFEGCSPVVPKQTVRIFDFQDFFTKQALALNASGAGVNKTIIEEEKVYSNTEKQVQWEKELSMFKNFALIKPEQEIMYTVDTMRSDRGFTYLVYTSENPRLKLQNAEVMYNPNHQVEKITLIVQSEEKINNSDITLTYLPLKGYDIKGDINSKIGGKSMIDIHAECIN
jgi:hypothetical protein